MSRLHHAHFSANENPSPSKTSTGGMDVECPRCGYSHAIASPSKGTLWCPRCKNQ